MFKPLILSNIAICWGAFPWFSMVLKKLLLLPQDKDRPPRCFFSSAQQTRIISQVLSPAQAPHILSGAGPLPLISRSPPQFGERSPPHPPSTDSYRVAGNDTGFKIGQLRFSFAQPSLCYSDRLLPKSTNVIDTILMVRLPVQGWAKSMLNRFGKVWHFHE